VIKGQDIREQFGMNQWLELERNRVITSLAMRNGRISNLFVTETGLKRGRPPMVRDRKSHRIRVKAGP
jgi:hypothetical protein